MLKLCMAVLAIRNHRKTEPNNRAGITMGQSQSTTEKRLDQRNRCFCQAYNSTAILVYRIKRVYGTPDTTTHNDDNDVDNTLNRYRSKETRIPITQIKPNDHRIYLYIALFICLIK